MLVAGDAAAGAAELTAAAAGSAAAATPVVVNPQPCFPESKATATAEQTPFGLAQHAEAQSASLKHCPVMNCWPFAFPTFCAPGADVSTASVPVFAVSGAAAMVVAADDAELATAELAPPSPKPQPVFPAWNCAPRPEQMPRPLLLNAQHAVEAQSFELRHSPPINCSPALLPMFFTPAGSGVAGLGAAQADMASGPGVS